MKKNFITTLLLTQLLVSALPAQEKSVESLAPPKQLITAIRDQAKDVPLYIDGETSREVGESPIPGMPGMATGSPFVGRFEIARPKIGEILMTSRTKLPGFSIYRVGEQTVSRLRAEDEQLAIDQFTSDLLALLDF